MNANRIRGTIPTGIGKLLLFEKFALKLQQPFGNGAGGGLIDEEFERDDFV